MVTPDDIYAFNPDPTFKKVTHMWAQSFCDRVNKLLERNGHSAPTFEDLVWLCSDDEKIVYYNDTVRRKALYEVICQLEGLPYNPQMFKAMRFDVVNDVDKCRRLLYKDFDEVYSLVSQANNGEIKISPYKIEMLTTLCALLWSGLSTSDALQVKKTDVRYDCVKFNGTTYNLGNLEALVLKITCGLTHTQQHRLGFNISGESEPTEYMESPYLLRAPYSERLERYHMASAMSFASKGLRSQGLKGLDTNYIRISSQMHHIHKVRQKFPKMPPQKAQDPNLYTTTRGIDLMYKQWEKAFYGNEMQ